MPNYDIIIIGSGPAGQRGAIYATKQGKKVAVVERMRSVGGVCINTGTIPSKTMREAVLHLSGYNYRSIYGMNYRVKERITMADLAFRVQHVEVPAHGRGGHLELAAEILDADDSAVANQRAQVVPTLRRQRFFI